MKSTIRLIAATVILVIAGSSAANAQRGAGRMMHDTAFMKKEGFPMMQMRHMNAPMYEQMCPGCRMGMYHGARGGMRPGMGWGPYAGQRMRPGYGWGPAQQYRGGAGFGQFDRAPIDGRPGIGRLENIPNLTDKQKKDIADLRLKQAEEAKKLREESLAKMKTLREDHRKKVLGLLTEEQKKYLDGNTGATAPETKNSGK